MLGFEYYCSIFSLEHFRVYSAIPQSSHENRWLFDEMTRLGILMETIFLDGSALEDWRLLDSVHWRGEHQRRNVAAD